MDSIVSKGYIFKKIPAPPRNPKPSSDLPRRVRPPGKLAKVKAQDRDRISSPTRRVPRSQPWHAPRHPCREAHGKWHVARPSQIPSVRRRSQHRCPREKLRSNFHNFPFFFNHRSQAGLAPPPPRISQRNHSDAPGPLANEKAQCARGAYQTASPTESRHRLCPTLTRLISISHNLSSMHGKTSRPISDRLRDRYHPFTTGY